MCRGETSERSREAQLAYGVVYYCCCRCLVCAGCGWTNSADYVTVADRSTPWYVRTCICAPKHIRCISIVRIRKFSPSCCYYIGTLALRMPGSEGCRACGGRISFRWWTFDCGESLEFFFDCLTRTEILTSRAFGCRIMNTWLCSLLPQ